MSTSRYADWRADLDASRDLSDLDKQSYGFVLGWFESWRLRKGLRAERPTAVAFWKEQVMVKPRKDWQQERWAEGIRWFLGWLDRCRKEGLQTRTVA